MDQIYTFGDADVRIGDSHIMLNDAVMGGKGPKAIGGSPASLWLYVEDCDALYRRALKAGATSISEPQDQPYGDRSGGVTDPFGNKWYIATHVKDVM